MHRKNKSIALLLSVFLINQAAAVQGDLFSTQISESLGCENFPDLLWNKIYKNIEDAKNIDEIKNTPKIWIANDALLSGDSNQLVELLLREIPENYKIESKAILVEKLSALEMGDQSTSQKRNYHQRITRLMNKIKERSQRLGLPCQDQDERLIQNKNKLSVLGVPMSPIDGATKFFTSYFQSCSVADVASLKSTDPDVKGITIVGTHSDGVGKKRIVSSVSELNRSNPYLASIRRFEPGCQDVKVSPPIYDYGGKPYVTSSLNSPLNFFINAGSGTAALGVDCSALVFSAFATAGLKFKSSVALKAISVNGVSSTMLANPEKNGLDCLQKPSFVAAKSLLAGDIIAKPGHVVLVVGAGPDPFGVGQIKNISDCSSDKMRTENFDFKILQSSPIKGGIGVNQIEISEYLKLSSSWKSGLIFYAVKACRAKFGQFSSAAAPDGLAVVRHKNSEQCRAQRIELSREACVNRCASTSNQFAGK